MSKIKKKVFQKHFVFYNIDSNIESFFFKKNAAEKQFQNLSIAYKILVDEKERNYYDNWRNGSIKINYKMWRELVVKKGHVG